jgi:putative peptide zinc metalloprotease protein
VRRIVTAWVLVVVPLLLFAMIEVLLHLPGYATTAYNSAMRYGDMAAQAFLQRKISMSVVAGVSMVMIILPWVGIVILLGQTLRRTTTNLIRRAGQARILTAKPRA